MLLRPKKEPSKMAPIPKKRRKLERLDDYGLNVDDFELCWTKIFPFMALQDIVTLSQTDKRYLKIIPEFFKSGQRLTLEKQFEEDFPIKSNRKLYNLLGKEATKVTISGIDKDDLDKIFASTPNITDLTLENVWILQGVALRAPRKLQHLKISNCKLNTKFIKWWFDLICPTIQSFTLANSPHEQFEHNLFSSRHLDCVCTSFVSALVPSNIRRLSISGMECKFGWNFDKFETLEYLHIQSPVRRYRNPVDSKLERELLAMEGQSVTSEITKFLKNSQRFQEKILRVTRCSSQEEQAKLNLSDGHVREEIKHWGNHPPGEPNLIIDKLSDDCLLEIFSYLSMEDFMSLFIAHPHFERCISENTVTRRMITVDAQLIKTYPFPEYQQSFKAILRNLTFLELNGITPIDRCTSGEVFEMLSYCEKLKKLELSNVDLKSSGWKSDIIKLPTKLTELKLITSNISPPNLLTEWYRLLDPTLRTLQASFRNMEGELDLTNLHNIRKLKAEFESREKHEKLLLFLQQNKDALEELHLESADGEWTGADFEEFNVLLPQLVNLKKFSTRAFAPHRPLDLSGLHQLQILKVDFPRSVIVDTENIKKLTIHEGWFYDMENETFDIEDIVPFRNVEDLKIMVDVNDYQPLYDLKRLHKLRLPHEDYEERIKKIIKNCPSLTRIEVGTTMPFKFGAWLRKYLHTENRTLEINLKDILQKR